MNPEWLRDYCAVVTNFFITHFRATIEAAGRPDGVRICEDMGYKGALFCSPRSLEELIFPSYRKLVDFFHSYDIPVVLHSCGYVEEALRVSTPLTQSSVRPVVIRYASLRSPGANASSSDDLTNEFSNLVTETPFARASATSMQ